MSLTFYNFTDEQQSIVEHAQTMDVPAITYRVTRRNHLPF